MRRVIVFLEPSKEQGMGDRVSDTTKTTGGRRKPAESASSPPQAEPADPAPSPPPAEPVQPPAPSPPPAEPAQPASSQPTPELAEPSSSPPPAKDASTTPAAVDGGGAGKGGTSTGTGTGTGGTGRGVPIAFILIVVAATFVFILASVFLPYIFTVPKLDKTLLQLLADPETARGLITFLVAVSTVGIALVLIVYLASSTAEVEVVKERFGFSKEVLTSLIGILGTIIGFYFGATQNQTQGHGTPTALTLADISITPPNPVKDQR
jgi:hypothetical protein